MSTLPSLLCKIHDRCYGIDATAVDEIVLIPAVQSIAAPSVAHWDTSIVGVINRRGTWLPVVDLSQQLGQGKHTYALSDSLIVLNHEDHQVGILVNEVLDVVVLSSETLSLGNEVGHPDGAMSRQDGVANASPVMGIAQHDEDVVVLLDVVYLINRRCSAIPYQEPHSNGTGDHQGDRPIPSYHHEQSHHEPYHHEQSVFFPNATEAERQRLQERADNLRQIIATESDTKSLSMAVISIQGEHFAMPVAAIREFTSIRGVTPIPCCPSHILGNMNLRGEILTLIDIRHVLNLMQHSPLDLSKAVVVQVDEIIAGIAVDSVFDVVSFEPSSISPIPVGAHTGHEDYFRGVISYQDSQASVLNLTQLLKSNELVVNNSE